MDMSASHLGSTHSSPESFDDDTGMMGTANWQHMPPPVQTAPPSIAGSSTASSVPIKTPLPLQKRRRVTRACDECRRKKIKCDGKQPCTHCTVYSYGSYIFPRCPHPGGEIDENLTTIQCFAYSIITPTWQSRGKKKPLLILILLLLRMYLRPAFKSETEPRPTVHRGFREQTSANRSVIEGSITRC